MKRLKVEFTVEELTLLASLAADQLFRREFIDPKMPGYRGDPAEIPIGKALVARLKEAAGRGYRGPRQNSSSSATRRSDRVAGAV